MVIQAEATYHGTIDFLIFYKRQGKNCVRVVPEKVRQNDATKASARLFGKASKSAAEIRKKLVAIIPVPDNIRMQTRFTTVLFQWMKANVPLGGTRIKKLNLIRNFQFTTTGPSFARRCKIKPKFSVLPDDQFQICIPPFIPKKSVVAPAKTISVKLKVALVSCKVGTGKTTGSHTVEFDFPYDATKVGEQIYSLKMPVPKGSLLLAGATLEYRVKNLRTDFIYRKKSFIPAAIISAVYI
jgi:hypothetical protein